MQKGYINQYDGPNPIPKDGWRLEIDKEYQGYRYVVVQHGMGHRCGYVAVTSSHPAWEMSYDRLNSEDVHVHGGLTYSRPYGPPESNGLWWFGFDYAHCDDGVDLEAVPEEVRGYYKYRACRHVWTADEVEEECKDLIDQLIALIDPLNEAKIQWLTEKSLALDVCNLMRDWRIEERDLRSGDITQIRDMLPKGTTKYSKALAEQVDSLLGCGDDILRRGYYLSSSFLTAIEELVKETILVEEQEREYPD